jgi:pSer/pThr/pTyr-binding forkhead associated (FHA) protein
MPHALLEILKYFLLAIVWLFFIYAGRMVLVEVRRSRPERPVLTPIGTAGAAAASPGSGARSAEVRPSPSEGGRGTPLHLRVLDPPRERGRLYDLGSEVTLGRSPGCGVALEDDAYASTLHARVYERNGELWLEDLGSTNGTYLNDLRLAAPARLQRGDRLTIGGTVLEVTR